MAQLCNISRNALTSYRLCLQILNHCMMAAGADDSVSKIILQFHKLLNVLCLEEARVKNYLIIVHVWATETFKTYDTYVWVYIKLKTKSNYNTEEAVWLYKYLYFSIKPLSSLWHLWYFTSLEVLVLFPLVFISPIICEI